MIAVMAASRLLMSFSSICGEGSSWASLLCGRRKKIHGLPRETTISHSQTALDEGPGGAGRSAGELERELDAGQRVRAGAGALGGQRLDDLLDQGPEPGDVLGEDLEHFAVGDALALDRPRV